MRVQLDYKVISRASRNENKTVEFQMPMIDNAKFETESFITVQRTEFERNAI